MINPAEVVENARALVAAHARLSALAVERARRVEEVLRLWLVVEEGCGRQGCVRDGGGDLCLDCRLASYRARQRAKGVLGGGWRDG